jgi:hypothetical protein
LEVNFNVAGSFGDWDNCIHHFLGQQVPIAVAIHFQQVELAAKTGSIG